MDDQLRELVALGREHFQRGDYSLAAGHLEQAVARGVAFADVHHMLGVIYHHLGEFEAAQRALQKALEINPADIEGAVAEFRIAVQHAPAYVPARVALGTALYAGGKVDEAIQQWEEVLRMDPQHRMAGMYLKMARTQARKAGS